MEAVAPTLRWRRPANGMYVAEGGYSIQRGPSWQRQRCWTASTPSGGMMVFDTLHDAKGFCERDASERERF